MIGANYSGIAAGTLVIGNSAPHFTARLNDTTVVAAATVLLRAEVSVSPPAQFQWQRKPRGAEAFTDLTDTLAFTGTTTSSLTIVAATSSMHGDQYRSSAASGPGLRPLGVTDATDDPTLQVFAASGTVIAASDNWSQSLASIFTQVGAFPLEEGSKDAAPLLTVLPGSHTIQLTNTNASPAAA